jgi:DNA-cytosine methyltransferase
MGKIKVGSDCCGVGSLIQAVKRLGIDYEESFACDFDYYARLNYCIQYGTDGDVQIAQSKKHKFFCDEVKRIALMDVSIEVCDEDKQILVDANEFAKTFSFYFPFNMYEREVPVDPIDLYMSSVPCFSGDTLINTSEGFVQIKDINIGDMVLTHNNKYEKVIAKGSKYSKILNVKAQGILETKTTENHKYYVREKSYVYKNRTQIRVFSEPKWIEAKNLTKNHFIGINIPQLIENKYSITEEIAYILGRYVADGWLRESKYKGKSKGDAVMLAIGKDKVDEISTKIKVKHHISKEINGVRKLFIFSNGLVNLIKEIGLGKGAINKRIPQSIINLPIDILKHFVNGYMDGDGHIHKDAFRATSISKELLMGLQLCIAKIHNVNSNLRIVKTPNTTIIQGRVVNQRDYYVLEFRKEMRKQSNAVVIDDKIWYPIKYIKQTEEVEEVYDITVENDHSYTANQAIVHNCQSFSLAGKRKGKDDKRGILFFSSLDFIRDNKPKYFIFENVKGLLSHDKTDKKAKYGKTFSEWINYLGGKSINGNATFIPYEDSVPYHIYFQVLNAKEHGVPQNRERIFIVGIRDDADNSFRFPIKEVLKLRLKDVLEPIVDEKYFLSDKMVEYMITRADNFNNGKINYKDEESIASTITKSSASLDISDNIIKVGFINQDTQASQVYSDNGVSPNMCAGTHGYANGYVESGVVEDNTPEVRQLNPSKESGGKQPFQHNRVYDVNGVMTTLDTDARSKNILLDEPTIVAMRGRYNEDGVIEQNIEPNDNSTSNAITTVQKDNLVMVSSEPNPIVEYQLTGGKWDKTHEQSGRVYDKNGVAPTIHTMGGGNQEPKIAVEQNFIQGGTQEHQTKRNDGISPCLTGAMGMGGGQIPIHNYNKRIRKLTPTEVFRLMDFEESFMDNVKKYNEANPKNSLSDSQLYRQGGNSIVVACLEKIIRNLKINFE